MQICAIVDEGQRLRPRYITGFQLVRTAISPHRRGTVVPGDWSASSYEESIRYRFSDRYYEYKTVNHIDRMGKYAARYQREYGEEFHCTLLLV